MTAVAGAACISSSAVVMQLAGSSPSLTALGRCAFALPVLGVLAWRERRRGAAVMTARSRWLARTAGVFLAGDLILWSHSIADIGAGLGTVVTNLQVVLVALLAWAFLGERPRGSLLAALPVMLGGLVLVGGLAGTGGYGTHPMMGAVFGLGVAVLYAAYILMLRQATADRTLTGMERAPVVAPLLQATIGATVGSAVLGLVLRDFRLGPAWPGLARPRLAGAAGADLSGDRLAADHHVHAATPRLAGRRPAAGPASRLAHPQRGVPQRTPVGAATRRRCRDAGRSPDRGERSKPQCPAQRPRRAPRRLEPVARTTCCSPARKRLTCCARKSGRTVRPECH